MAERSPAFQLYPKDFLSSENVKLMSMTERGVYITLLLHEWIEGSIPADPVLLARMVHMKAPQFRRMWSQGPLHRCFVERDGRLVNLRLERERQAQAEYRQKQKDRADKRWNPSGSGGSGGAGGGSGNAVALPRHMPPPCSDGTATDMPVPQSRSDALHPHPLSASSSSSAIKTHTQGAPIHDTSHKKHAHCGRVCVPADLHGRFVRARNHDNADMELRDWYLVVEEEWTTGARKTANTGGDDYAFWRARFNEKWPADPSSQPDRRLPAWARS